MNSLEEKNCQFKKKKKHLQLCTMTCDRIIAHAASFFLAPIKMTQIRTLELLNRLHEFCSDSSTGLTQTPQSSLKTDIAGKERRDGFLLNSHRNLSMVWI